MRRFFAALALSGALIAAPASAQQSSTLYVASSPITPGTDVEPGTGVSLACSAAGVVRLVMAKGTTLDVQASVGQAIIDRMAIKGVSVSGTTATCVVTVLRNF
jgi:hypothetical protein